MSTNDTSTPVRRVQAGTLQISVSYNRLVHDEDAGYPFSQFRVTITDPDHDVPGHDEMLMLDGNHWTLDEATIEAVCFLATDATAYADPSAPDFDLSGTYVPNSYTDPSVPQALAANGDELRALQSIFDRIDDAGGDPIKVLGRVDLERRVDLAALTEVLDPAPGGEGSGHGRSARGQDHPSAESGSRCPSSAPTRWPMNRDRSLGL